MVLQYDFAECIKINVLLEHYYFLDIRYKLIDYESKNVKNNL
jgi:hypothetical protein